MEYHSFSALKGESQSKPNPKPKPKKNKKNKKKVIFLFYAAPIKGLLGREILCQEGGDWEPISNDGMRGGGYNPTVTVTKYKETHATAYVLLPVLQIDGKEIHLFDMRKDEFAYSDEFVHFCRPFIEGLAKKSDRLIELQSSGIIAAFDWRWEEFINSIPVQIRDMYKRGLEAPWRINRRGVCDNFRFGAVLFPPEIINFYVGEKNIWGKAPKDFLFQNMGQKWQLLYSCHFWVNYKE